MVVAVGQPNIALSAWPPLAAKIPGFEQTPAAMLPLLVVRVRSLRQGHGTNALPSRLVSGGERRTSSHARVEIYGSGIPGFEQANEQKWAYGSSKFWQGDRIGTLGLTFIQGCKSTLILVLTVSTPVRKETASRIEVCSPLFVPLLRKVQRYG